MRLARGKEFRIAPLSEFGHSLAETSMACDTGNGK